MCREDETCRLLSYERAGALQGLYQVLTPIMQRAGTDFLKVQEFYPARSGKEALLEAVAIEQGIPRKFFVQFKQHEKAITVRLLSATDPEKTHTVKKVMAMVAGFIRKAYQANRHGKTNLQEFLEATTGSM